MNLDAYRAHGTSGELLERFRTPEAARACWRAWTHCKPSHGKAKGRVADHEAFVLWRIAHEFDEPAGAPIVEVGTLYGFSAAVLASAAPSVCVITMSPVAHEVVTANRNLRAWPNVIVHESRSDDWLAEAEAGNGYGLASLVFIDGDHKRAMVDVPYWNLVRAGGVMLWHDYNEWQSPPVKEAVDTLARHLGRPPDIEVVDSDRVGRGLAGFYRRAEDRDIMTEDDPA